jgi:hypothetical protein
VDLLRQVLPWANRTLEDSFSRSHDVQGVELPNIKRRRQAKETRRPYCPHDLRLNVPTSSTKVRGPRQQCQRPRPQGARQNSVKSTILTITNLSRHYLNLYLRINCLLTISWESQQSIVTRTPSDVTATVSFIEKSDKIHVKAVPELPRATVIVELGLGKTLKPTK